MKEDQARLYLLKHYEDKSNQHIRNLYAVIASILGFLISGKSGIIIFNSNFTFTEILIIIAAPFFYFLIRASYWNARIWQVKKIQVNEDISTTFIHTFENEITKIINKYPGLYPQIYRTTDRFRYKLLFWFIIPGLFFLIFLLGVIKI
jgi:hypothetical protein